MQDEEKRISSLVKNLMLKLAKRQNQQLFLIKNIITDTSITLLKNSIMNNKNPLNIFFFIIEI